MVGMGSNNFLANHQVLDGKNWEKWCIQIRVIFNVHVSEYVSERLQPLAENVTDAQKKA